MCLSDNEVGPIVPRGIPIPEHLHVQYSDELKQAWIVFDDWLKLGCEVSLQMPEVVNDAMNLILKTPIPGYDEGITGIDSSCMVVVLSHIIDLAVIEIMNDISERGLNYIVIDNEMYWKQANNQWNLNGQMVVDPNVLQRCKDISDQRIEIIRQCLYILIKEEIPVNQWLTQKWKLLVSDFAIFFADVWQGSKEVLSVFFGIEVKKGRK